MENGIDPARTLCRSCGLSCADNARVSHEQVPSHKGAGRPTTMVARNLVRHNVVTDNRARNLYYIKYYKLYYIIFILLHYTILALYYELYTISIYYPTLDFYSLTILYYTISFNLRFLASHNTWNKT